MKAQRKHFMRIISSNAREDNNRTPLFHTIGLNLEISRVLVEFGGDMDTEDNKGYKPSDVLPIRIMH